MSKRIIEVYVAAVCLGATLLIMISASNFFRSRLATLQSQSETRIALAGYQAAPNLGNEEFQRELRAYKKNGLDYDAAREYLWFLSTVLAGHIFLLVATEVFFWRLARRRYFTTRSE